MTPKQDTQVDLLIAGGGASGLTLALALMKHTQLSVALVEASAAKDLTESASDSADFLELRSIALSAQSCRTLQNIGLGTLSDIACPIENIHVSDQGHLGQTTLHAKDYQLDSLGWVVELPALVKKLYQQCLAFEKRLHFFHEQQIQQITRTSKKVTATLTDGQVINATLLAVAEGATSATRDMLGIDIEVEDYGQMALVANVELTDPHGYWAYERFTPQGPLALLPLKAAVQGSQKHRCSLVWTMLPENYQSVMQSDDKMFVAELQRQFGYRLGTILNVGKRSGFPLSLIKASQHIHHRTVLLGNATQTLHPIAGQGFNLALRDVQQLVELVAGVDPELIGEYRLLCQYQQSRRPDQMRLINATNTLIHTFSNHYVPLVVGRNIALSLLDNLALPKKALAVKAMGFQTKSGMDYAEL